jgi:hypothetical protein
MTDSGKAIASHPDAIALFVNLPTQHLPLLIRDAGNDNADVEMIDRVISAVFSIAPEDPHNNFGHFWAPTLDRTFEETHRRGDERVIGVFTPPIPALHDAIEKRLALRV